MLSIDGKLGEGGGQIVRTALALSTLTGQPFTISNIRAARSKPGLKAQHLKCIETLNSWTGSQAEGAEIGSDDLTFYPGALKAKTVIIDIKTAGSITLLMQSLLLPALFSPGTVRFSIKGGTDVSWSPSWDYFVNVILPHFRSLGAIKASLLRRGYYPKGQGEVRLRVVPIQGASSPQEIFEITRTLTPLNITEQGTLQFIKGYSHASSVLQERDVAERQARACHHKLLNLGVPVDLQSSYQNTESTGSGITVFAQFSDRPDELNYESPIVLGADSLGNRRLSSEQVGESAGSSLLDSINSHAPIDSHLADNLIPLIGLCGGKMRVQSISSHTLTNMKIVEKFLNVKMKNDSTSIWRE